MCCRTQPVARRSRARASVSPAAAGETRHSVEVWSVSRDARGVGSAFPEAAEVILGTGVPYAGIIDAATSWRADLIVVASSSGSSFRNAVLGSVPERVVRYALCPVLVHRDSTGRKGVLAATDLSDSSLPAVTAAAEVARLRGESLSIVHAIDMMMPALGVAIGSPFGATPALPPQELQQQLRGVLLASLEQKLRDLGVSGQAKVVEGSPAQAIVDFCETLKAELIVVGTRGRTGLARLALGSVAEHVVRDAGVSVLAVRLGAGHAEA